MASKGRRGGPAYIVKPNGDIINYEFVLWDNPRMDSLGVSWIRGETSNYKWNNRTPESINSKYGDYIFGTKEEADIASEILKKEGPQEVNSKYGAYIFDTSGTPDTRIKFLKQQIQINESQKKYEARLAEVTSRENTYNTLADQIAGLTGTAGQGPVPQQIAANITGSLGSLSAFNTDSYFY